MLLYGFVSTRCENAELFLINVIMLTNNSIAKAIVWQCDINKQYFLAFLCFHEIKGNFSNACSRRVFFKLNEPLLRLCAFEPSLKESSSKKVS